MFLLSQVFQARSASQSKVKWFDICLFAIAFVLALTFALLAESSGVNLYAE